MRCLSKQAATIVNNRITGVLDGSHSRNNIATNQPNRFLNKEAIDNFTRTGKKIFIAVNHWEQLTATTNNFFDLTALAAYGGRQVVVPFVNNSRFHASPTTRGFETLALYYNVTALNRTLRSRGHGTLISWKEFQEVCQGKLDVLVHFDYTKLKKTKAYTQATMEGIYPCKNTSRNTLREFKIEKTICVNVFAVHSIEKFENDIVKRLPCVGLAEWRGSNNKRSYRAQFDLSSVVTHVMRTHDAASFFSPKILHVAQDFVAKNLGPLFFSVHIRTEKILQTGNTLRNISTVRKCISNLSTLVQKHKNVSTAHIPVFLAADFADYGSSTRQVKPARENANSLMKILAPLKPVIFQPSAYNLTDRGAVAIVEMNILVSAKHLFVVGGGFLADEYGSYIPAFYMTGIVNLVSAAFIFCFRL
ncbi:hypothetical protein ACROYT_G032728 [Oculina patagonica]